ncbi:MAG: Head fiber protein [Anaerovoracaceae bacterium]
MGNTKNYTEQGGDKWIISGTLEVTADGQIIIEGIQLTRAEVQADSTATTVSALKDDFNSLLSKLKSAGLMMAD